MVAPKYKIDNDKTGTPEACKPSLLSQEAKHDRYSVTAAEDKYKKDIYYRQRKGGTGWFHGRQSQQYKDNYDRIFSN